MAKVLCATIVSIITSTKKKASEHRKNKINENLPLFLGACFALKPNFDLIGNKSTLSTTTKLKASANNKLHLLIIEQFSNLASRRRNHIQNA